MGPRGACNTNLHIDQQSVCHACVPRLYPSPAQSLKISSSTKNDWNAKNVSTVYHVKSLLSCGSLCKVNSQATLGNHSNKNGKSQQFFFHQQKLRWEIAAIRTSSGNHHLITAVRNFRREVTAIIKNFFGKNFYGKSPHIAAVRTSSGNHHHIAVKIR